MKKLLYILLGMGLLFFYIGKTSLKSGSTKGKPSKSQLSKGSVLKSELNYLNDIKEITWWEVDDNDVYINFEPLPTDWNMIIRAAALKGNKAIDFGVHVWSMSGKQKGWRPGDSGYTGSVTARYGKIK